MTTNKEIDHKEASWSEEHGGGGNHREHPQPLSPRNPYESHDDRVEDVLGTLAEFESELCRGEGTRPVKLGDDCLGIVIKFELVGCI